jgi:hypothetical protein
MARKISAEVATRILLDHGLKPLEPYKNSKSRWKSTHLECGSTCYPMLEKVKIGQISCSICRYKTVAKTLRLSEEKARRAMISAGFEPLEPYVNALTKWKCRHLACGRTVYPLLNTIQRGGGGCKSCGSVATGFAKRNSLEKVTEKLREKGFVLLGSYRDSKTPIKVKCLKCGEIFLGLFTVISRKTGRGCKKCALIINAKKFKLSPDVLAKRLARVNLEMIGDYKNSKTTIRCRCLKCKKQFGICKTLA